MEFYLQVLMPLSMFLIMWIIGTELSLEDFHHVRRRSALVVTVSLCQLLVLPLLVFLVFWSFSQIPVAIMIGMLIMAAGPGGGLSNMLVAKIEGNTALSIALTSIGSVACMVSMPVVFAVSFPLVAERTGDFELPLQAIIGQLVLFMIIPVALGMWTRYKWPVFMQRHQQRLRRTTSILLVAIIIYSLTMKSEVTFAQFINAVPYGIGFMLFCAIVGKGFGMLFKLDWPDTKTLMVEYTCQSAAIPTLIVLSILKQPQWMVFVGAVGVLQLILALVLIFWQQFKPQSS